VVEHWEGQKGRQMRDNRGRVRGYSVHATRGKNQERKEKKRGKKGFPRKRIVPEAWLKKGEFLEENERIGERGCPIRRRGGGDGTKRGKKRCLVGEKAKYSVTVKTYDIKPTKKA